MDWPKCPFWQKNKTSSDTNNIFVTCLTMITIMIILILNWLCCLRVFILFPIYKCSVWGFCVDFGFCYVFTFFSNENSSSFTKKCFTLFTRIKSKFFFNKWQWKCWSIPNNTSCLRQRDLENNLCDSFVHFGHRFESEPPNFFTDKVHHILTHIWSRFI